MDTERKKSDQGSAATSPVLISKKLLINTGIHAVVEPNIGDFPLHFFRQEFSPQTYQFIDWHWHTGPQFCFVTKGGFQFRIMQHRHVLKEGDGIFINAQQVHMAMPENPYTGEYLCLNYSPHLLGLEGSYLFQNFIAPVLYQLHTPYLILDQSEPNISQLLIQLEYCAKEAEQARENYDLKLFSDLLLLWNELLKVLPDRKRTNIDHSKDNIRMQNILLYLKENLTRKITLEEIATQVHLSRSECSRFFHSVAGQTLFGYLAELRINHSIELLAHTNKTITEIAYESGFGSQSYYTQRFRAVKRTSPEQFRKMLRE